MKNKKQRFSDLFYDNRFVLVFSLIAAVVIWLVVVVEFSPEITILSRAFPFRLIIQKLRKISGLSLSEKLSLPLMLQSAERDISLSLTIRLTTLLLPQIQAM